MTIGEPDGSEPIRVRATQNVPGIYVHGVAWVTGAAVPALIATSTLVRL